MERSFRTRGLLLGGGVCLLLLAGCLHASTQGARGDSGWPEVQGPGSPLALSPEWPRARMPADYWEPVQRHINPSGCVDKVVSDFITAGTAEGLDTACLQEPFRWE